MTDNITPFERMINAVKKVGYTPLEEIFGEDGAHGFMYCNKDVIFYIGEPTGMEWYWKLDGKIAVDNNKSFNKWSQVPFYVWLPESDDEANRIIEAICFLSTNKGYELSNEYGECHKKFGFDIPNPQIK